MGLVLAWSLIREAGPLSVLVYTNVKLNQLIGLASVLVVLGYLVWVSLRRRAVKMKGWRLELPGFRLSLAQMLMGPGDVCAGAGVLFVLLPGGHNINFETFLAVYVFAVMIGIASHAPGGLGVFEATILLALSSLPREPVLGALLLYRICYYFLPFLVASPFSAATKSATACGCCAPNSARRIRGSPSSRPTRAPASIGATGDRRLPSMSAARDALGERARGERRAKILAFGGVAILTAAAVLAGLLPAWAAALAILALAAAGFGLGRQAIPTAAQPAPPGCSPARTPGGQHPCPAPRARDPGRCTSRRA
jgi:uncharacterized membrane protein YbhN (UPF0104 family)